MSDQGKHSLGSLRDVFQRTQFRIFSGSATEEDSLSPFPGFNADEEQDSLDRHYAPFPGDGLMFEDDVVQNGDIKDREHGDPSGHDGLEKELVPPDVVHPLGKVFLGFWLHTEERPAHIDHFPSQEQRKPSQAHERSGTCSED